MSTEKSRLISNCGIANCGIVRSDRIHNHAILQFRISQFRIRTSSGAFTRSAFNLAWTVHVFIHDWIAFVSD